MDVDGHSSEEHREPNKKPEISYVDVFRLPNIAEPLNGICGQASQVRGLHVAEA